jgi:transposase-like protein
MDFASLIERFGSEDKCHTYLEQLRWPDGVKCPRCGSDKISRIVARRQFDCDSCRYQFSVRVGTIFHDSKLPLWKWFLATYMITHAKKGVAALRLQTMLGVSYKTAWFLSHRIRSAMADPDAPKLLGIVEVDEAWIGGKTNTMDRKKWTNKRLVAGALERNGKVRFGIIKDQRRRTLHKFVAEKVDDNATAVFTDDLHSYRGVADYNTEHQSVNHSAGEYVRGQVHVNGIESVWGLVKRSVYGTYHHISPKHLPAYLEERAFVFNNRENPHIFRDTIIALCQSENLTFEKLVA